MSEPNESQNPLGFDLRTRIIAALLSEDDVALMADAVIRELGLHRESPQLCPGGSTSHRYVTEWTTDE